MPGPVLSAISDMPVTVTMMIIMVLTSIAGFFNKAFLIKLIHHPVSMISGREYCRVLTSDLVHNDPIHLVVNEGMMLFICGTLETYLRAGSSYGSMIFAGIYLTSHLAGILATTIRHRRNFEYSSAGASGSICGCMMCFMILQPKVIAFYLPVVGGVTNLYAGLIVFAGLIIYQRRTKNELMDHELHFYSAVGGIIATVLIFNKLTPLLILFH